jgi:hypothetical protein
LEYQFEAERPPDWPVITKAQRDALRATLGYEGRITTPWSGQMLADLREPRLPASLDKRQRTPSISARAPQD